MCVLWLLLEDKQNAELALLLHALPTASWSFYRSLMAMFGHEIAACIGLFQREMDIISNSSYIYTIIIIRFISNSIISDRNSPELSSK